MERFYPLHAYVCAKCLLVQLEEFETPTEIFTDYAYFSSYSESWLQHSKQFVNQVIDSVGLAQGSFVIELASNDGYLLKNFVEAGIPCLGIEPAANVAAEAIKQKVPTMVAFFGSELGKNLATDGKSADLIIANNVLAHVPDLNDFLRGVKHLLKPDGTATFEFPHLKRLIEFNQFDTIYHEHFSYFSLLTTAQIFKAHGLSVYKVDELQTHGGSLRLYVSHAGRHKIEDSVGNVLAEERKVGLDNLETYRSFQNRVHVTKRRLLSFLIAAKNEGKNIAAYGAAAKGTTLLNYCGIGSDFIDYIVDKNTYKQDRFLPGSHIPIYSPERIFETKPDYVLILPWNIREEVMKQLSGIRAWGGAFAVPIPDVTIFD